nr:NAD(P)H-binding protein [Angustibacter aerolatus]
MAGDDAGGQARRMQVAVAGASGFVGSRLAAALTAAGHDVRALTRHPERYTGAGTPLAADVDDPATLGAALAGCEPGVLPGAPPRRARRGRGRAPLGVRVRRGGGRGRGHRPGVPRRAGAARRRDRAAERAPAGPARRRTGAGRVGGAAHRGAGGHRARAGQRRVRA